MSNELATYDRTEGLETALIQGDLSKLTPAERSTYYLRVCESVGLNPLTKPFSYLSLSGKTVLYANRDCTDQLRKVNGVSIKIVSRETIEGVYVVTANAVDRDNRVDESTGAVNVKGLAGDNLANAFMKAETKAKRRVTLSICGLGMLDESEVTTIPGAVILDENLNAAGKPHSPPATNNQESNEPTPAEMKAQMLQAIASDKFVNNRSVLLENIKRDIGKLSKDDQESVWQACRDRHDALLDPAKSKAAADHVTAGLALAEDAQDYDNITKLLADNKSKIRVADYKAAQAKIEAARKAPKKDPVQNPLTGQVSTNDDGSEY